MENQQNEILSIDTEHSLDEVVRLASMFPNTQTSHEADIFDIDAVIA